MITNKLMIMAECSNTSFIQCTYFFIEYMKCYNVTQYPFHSYQHIYIESKGSFFSYGQNVYADVS